MLFAPTLGTWRSGDTNQGQTEELARKTPTRHRLGDFETSRGRASSDSVQCALSVLTLSQGCNVRTGPHQKQLWCRSWPDSSGVDFRDSVEQGTLQVVLSADGAEAQKVKLFTLAQVLRSGLARLRVSIFEGTGRAR